MRWADQAAEILTAAFVNLSAVVSRLQSADRDVHLLCAGTDQRISAEDLLLAGAIADRLGDRFHQNAETRIFREFWRARGENNADRLQVLRDSAGGRNLVELGFDRDIEQAGHIDLFDLSPRLKNGRIAIDP